MCSKPINPLEAQVLFRKGRELGYISLKKSFIHKRWYKNVDNCTAVLPQTSMPAAQNSHANYILQQGEKWTQEKSPNT